MNYIPATMCMRVYLLQLTITITGIPHLSAVNWFQKNRALSETALMSYTVETVLQCRLQLLYKLCSLQSFLHTDLLLIFQWGS
jgi:hypothetical protein